jgi:hypothetical protein
MVVLLVAALVLLAGCSGGGGVAPEAEGDSAGGGDDGMSGGTGGDGDSSSSSSVGDDSGESNDFELSDSEQILRDAGSFTVTWTYSGVDATGRETDVSREFYADLDEERSYTVISSMTDGQSDAGASEQFVTDGVTYFRSGSGDNVAYSSYEGSTPVIATAIALSQARAYGADDDMDFVGTETFDGVSVNRYELADANEALILAGSAAATNSADEMQVTSFEYAVLVDEDGLSRYESWSFSGVMGDGTEVSGSWEYSLTAVGSTTVDDPDWLAEAKAQSSG